MKHKVGDKVKIRSLEWYNKNCNKYGYIPSENESFVPEMSHYCGKTTTITEIATVKSYRLEIDKGYWYWTDEMFEEN